MQGAFIAEVIKEKKHPGKILQDWHKTLCGNGLTVAAALLMRAVACKGSSPCVESAFALRGQVLTPARSSMHTELTDVVTQRKYLRCGTHQNCPSPVFSFPLNSEWDPSQVLEMEAHRCSYHRVWDKPFEVALGSPNYQAMGESLNVVVWLKKADNSKEYEGWTATVKSAPKNEKLPQSFIAQDKKWTALGVQDAVKETIQQQEVHPSMDVWMPRSFYEAMRDAILVKKSAVTTKKHRKE